VLVVDDDPAVRSVLCRTMQAAGYSDLQVDLVVTDLRMPRMDGRQLAAQVAARYPHMRVMFISGYDAHLGSVDLLGPVIPKPFRAETLTECVQGVLGRE
jgi:CheY-like chemotaxis protein